MSGIRVPLYARFLVWSALNLVLILALAFGYAPHDQSGWNLLLTQSVRERLSAIAFAITDDLYNIEPEQWPQVIAQYQEYSHVRFDVRARPGPRPNPMLHDMPPQGGPPPQGEPPRDLVPGDSFGGPAPDDARGPIGPPGPRNADIGIRTAGSGFEVRISVMAPPHGGPPRGYIVTAHADDGIALLRLLGLGREIAFIVAALLLSAVLWWPFIWRITRRIAALAFATQQMSRGRLAARVVDERRDEIGELAHAFNSMAQRLDVMMAGQRQFVADIAHEVTSPIARMQIGLGILEGRLAVTEMAALNDIRDDLEQMAGMLDELLLFSRSGLEAERAPPTRVALKPMIDKIISEESSDTRVDCDVPADLFVSAQPPMLARALANLIRNARRYAAEGATPVEITALRNGARVQLLIRDRGPGVPPAALARLGEPFFRPEVARSRATGGFGLGLAIVRRCVAACEGNVIFRNRDGGGFEVELDLRLTD